MNKVISLDSLQRLVIIPLKRWIDQKLIEETDDDATELLYEMGVIDPITDEEGNVLTDENGSILTI